MPSPGHLPNPEIKLVSPALQAGILPAELPGKPPVYLLFSISLTTECFTFVLAQDN